MKRILRLDAPLDLGLTLRPFVRGRGDPTMRLERTEAWRATRTPFGPAAEHLRVRCGAVEVEAWGLGAEWLLDRAPALLGMHDDPAGFKPRHPQLREAHRLHPGLRIGRSDSVVESLVPTILEQKVTGTGARRSFRALVRAYGEPAPGPWSLLLCPEPTLLASLPYQEFHPLGVERRRAAAIKIACSYATRLEETIGLDSATAWRRLLALPGVGPWTAALVAGAAWGDADAVEVGDLHVPHSVCWFLAREPRGSDARMLQLLERYAGQRGRVIRLIGASGMRAPRYGPRAEVVSYAKI
ncbi:MAG: DNA-3-methyladenine glycosylase 2 family protein [Actinomycetota bacterium]|nr:DNA-3-methyladenine glycosylase 2 family protein [Actinomycetota bacterium]